MIRKNCVLPLSRDFCHLRSLQARPCVLAFFVSFSSFAVCFLAPSLPIPFSPYFYLVLSLFCFFWSKCVYLLLFPSFHGASFGICKFANGVWMQNECVQKKGHFSNCACPSRKCQYLFLSLLCIRKSNRRRGQKLTKN